MKEELLEITHTYPDTWGKLVKILKVKRFTNQNESLVSVEPDFVNIQNTSETGMAREQAIGEKSSKPKTGKFAVIVGLAKDGKNEKQIRAEIKNQYGSLSNATKYLIGRVWRRVNGCLRKRG